MIGFIQKILSKKRRSYYDRCYLEREKEGHAVFKCCCGESGGDNYTDGLSYTCVSCPYCQSVLLYDNEDITNTKIPSGNMQDMLTISEIECPVCMEKVEVEK